MLNKKDFSLFLKQNFAVIIVFAFIFFAGLLTFNQYGQSWDESLLRSYADEAIQAYSSWVSEGKVEFEHDWLKYYGPFFFMFTKSSSEFLQNTFSISLTDSDHLIYFITYFVGVMAFYSIAKRWLSQTASLGATLLFATQPLFWGHAFINPKDTPFMALFLLSIATGFYMVDKIKNEPIEMSSSKKLNITHAIWLLSIAFLFVFTEAIYNVISSLVISAKSGETNIITFIASKLNEVSAQAYIRRYFLLFLRLRTFYFISSVIFLFFVWRKFQPSLLRILFIVLFPAIVLGFTTSTRILGPFAGVIVAYYAIYKQGKKLLPAITIYALIAIVVMYLTWPFLWTNPVANFVASLNQMSAYPWLGQILLNGKLYYSYDLPYSYLPTLLFLQMTEPVWVLVVIGLVISLYNFKKNSELITLFTLWFLLPFGAFIIFRPVLYDNFRQVLFIFPPVFLIAGVVFEKIKNKVWQIVFITICLFPSIVGIISLHPYEYVYYNSFVSRTENLQDRFETDYWLTSYREAAEYVNRVAPAGATVWVEGQGNLYSIFAREDLDVYSWSRDQLIESYDYVVVTTRFGSYKTTYPDANIIYEIRRSKALLAVIKKP